MARLEVGRCLKGQDVFDVFIAATSERYDKARKPLSGEMMHFLRFQPDDLDWLIEALQKERDQLREERKQEQLAAKGK